MLGMFDNGFLLFSLVTVSNNILLSSYQLFLNARQNVNGNHLYHCCSDRANISSSAKGASISSRSKIY
jgi:hypothetical protein